MKLKAFDNLISHEDSKFMTKSRICCQCPNIHIVNYTEQGGSREEGPLITLE